MKKLLRAVWELLAETAHAWARDKASRWAAALAYYTIFSLAPLLVISLGIASAFLTEERAQRQLLFRVESIAGRGVAEGVETLLASPTEAETGILTTIISLATLFFGASAVFAALQDALNVIWNVPPNPNLSWRGVLKKRLISFLLVLLLGVMLIASALINAFIAPFDRFLSEFGPPAAQGFHLFDFVLTFLMLTVLLGLMFKILPDAEVAWGDVWIGAIVTALLFNLGRYLIGLYLRTAAVGSAYGAAGSFIVLLVWVYYSAQIIFFGAELTQVYANKYGSRVIPLHSVDT